MKLTDSRHIWHPFTQSQMEQDVTWISHGRDALLFLDEQEQHSVIDAISSWWLNIHGHGNKYVAAAIAKQAYRLEQVIFANFTHSPAINFAKALIAMLMGEQSQFSSFADAKIFFSDNGSTSVEVALKMAVQYHHNLGEKRPYIIAFSGGYHGDTIGAMSAGKSSGFFQPFADWLFEVINIDYPATWLDDCSQQQKEQQSLQQLEQLLRQKSSQICALIAEPLVQGAGGMNMCSTRYLTQVVELCQQYGVLVIFDEVMTGFGRTGEFFAFQHLEPQYAPDIICLSKGLTAGFLPMSVTVCKRYIHDAFLAPQIEKAFLHGHSFTANPLGCVAALASMELLYEAKTDIERISLAHEKAVAEIFMDNQHCHKIRQRGTILALDMRDNAPYGDPRTLRLKKFFLDNGVLLRPLGSTIYILPPYCISDDQLAKCYEVLASAISRVM